MLLLLLRKRVFGDSGAALGFTAAAKCNCVVVIASTADARLAHISQNSTSVCDTALLSCGVMYVKNYGVRVQRKDGLQLNFHINLKILSVERKRFCHIDLLMSEK